MKIFSTEQIRAADAYTIENEPIASIDLMERASLAFVEQFLKWFDASQTVYICCGTGNNGGDGLAIGRLLFEKNYQVTVGIVWGSSAGSTDFQANLKRLPRSIKLEQIKQEPDIPIFLGHHIIIDALFGSGLSRLVTGFYAKVINNINTAHVTVVAVDIASGLMADKVTNSDVIVKADYTVSFQFPKKAFLLPDNSEFVGRWVVVPIGLSQTYTTTTPTDAYLTTIDAIKPMLKTRPLHSHKGNYGKVLLIAGSQGKMGASILSSRASLRSGTGLLTVLSPASGWNILQTAVPEAMIIVDQSEKFVATLPEVTAYDAIGIGPGIATQENTVALFRALLTAFHRPIVIDADAINILSQHKVLLDEIPEGSILTPHVKEFQRMAGRWENDFERLRLQREFSMKYNVIIVFKGAYTTVSDTHGNCFFNTTGNPGMATAGSGDVLTGIITSLLGQGYQPLDAARLGVYLHGLAGDLAVINVGQNALIASDIIDNLGKAFLASQE